ncbi:hypothetical protein P3S67_000745 [Capsicum chacoense]
MSETNTKNRKKLMNPHTTGKKSFSLVPNKLENEKGRTLSLKEMFAETRARKSDRIYKTSNEDTTSKIAQMEEIETQQGLNEQPVDAFSTVMGTEHPGHVRLLGGRVTKTFLKILNDGFESSLNSTNDVVQQIQERMRKMKDQIEEQKRTIQKEVVADVIAQLQNA